jgi:hypothetical protein
MYAELFTAAIESAAFVNSERDELIQIGLSKIPEDCRVARSINIVLKAYADKLTWQEARELVVADSADLGWFQAPGNVAFSIIGWMYGEGDFSQSLLIATNCGDDTDCTAATLGAILGIILGKSRIPAEWIEPIGDRIITIAVDRGSFAPPATISQLTDQVMAMAPQVLASFGAGVCITDSATDLSGVGDLDLANTAVGQQICARSSYSVAYDLTHTGVELDYGKDPEIKLGEPFKLKLIFKNQMPDPRHLELIWHLPDGISVTPEGPNHIFLRQWDLHGLIPTELEVELTADYLCSGTIRGILEIIAEGRPTVGLIPLVFLSA